jgi:hypothetical protein
MLHAISELVHITQLLTIKKRRKIGLVTKCYSGPWTSMDYLERHKQQKLYMRFGTWKVRTLCRARSLRKVAKELRKYKI